MTRAPGDRGNTRRSWTHDAGSRGRTALLLAGLGIAFAGVFVGINMRFGRDLAAVVDALVMVAMLGGVLVALRKKAPEAIAVAGLISLILVIIGAGSQRLVAALLWSYALPAPIFFVLGLKRGMIANAILIVCVGALSIFLPPLHIGDVISVSVISSYGFVLVFGVVYERARFAQEQRLSELSLKDLLTGVANRRGLDQAIEAETARARRYDVPLSVIIFDIDLFKVVNDNHGHSAGDSVLKCIAEVAAHETRETDLVARFGGDEFVVLLPETPCQGAVVVAERLRQTVERDVTRRVRSRLPPGAFTLAHDITITSGVAQFRSSETFAELLHRADAALLEAKRRGRNCVVEASPIPPA